MKYLVSAIQESARPLLTKSEEELLVQVHSLKQSIQKEIKEKKKKNFRNLFSPRSNTSFLVNWFALAQELSFRTLGLRHYPTQLEAGLWLETGKVVEMKTGEGKTLASTLPISFHALYNEGVHVVTVNDYLAKRDAQWMMPLYLKLESTVGIITSESPLEERKESYEASITYVTNSELVFDYLRDCSALCPEELVQRPFSYAILDEMDSILIDEARTPLILSANSGEINNELKLFRANIVSSFLSPDIHFQINEKQRDISLTEVGYELLTKLFQKSLYEFKDSWILEILNALKAKFLYTRNKHYIVLNNKICIIDESTGRLMDDRRWGNGLHEAIESKEELIVKDPNRTKSAITYQNFFTLYPKLTGMTGTAKTSEKEFREIYDLDVVVLPTAKPLQRKDFADLVYSSEKRKWKGVVETAQDYFKRGQPLLIGTTSVEKSELLASLFRVALVPYQLLNAKPENVTRESEIVAQAGKRFAITIATNMAGRGTDIILGGNPSFQVKKLLSDLLIERIPFLSLNQEDIVFYSLDPVLLDTKVNLIRNLVEKINIQYEEKYKNESAKKLEEDLFLLCSSFSYGAADIKKVDSLSELYQVLYEVIFQNWKKENKHVKTLGGLHVLGTERHETRRIDNQLRGRAGRQGDPGSSQFFISFEDEMLKVFGSEKLQSWINLFVDQKTALTSPSLTESLEAAQEKVESYFYDIRKNTFEYDSILNLHRKKFFLARRELFSEDFWPIAFLQLKELASDQISFDYISSFNRLSTASLFEQIESWQTEIISPTILDNSFLLCCLEEDTESYNDYEMWKWKTINPIKTEDNRYPQLWLTQDLENNGFFSYDEELKKREQLELVLGIVDEQWAIHLEAVQGIHDTVSWRSFGQQNPVFSYNNSCEESFQYMFKEINEIMLYL